MTYHIHQITSNIESRSKNRQYCFLLFILIFSLVSCSKEQPYTILEFTGNGSVDNESKSPYIKYEADSNHSAFILAELGDIISLNWESFYFEDRSQKKYNFKIEKNHLYINDKLYSIDCSRNDSLTFWCDSLISVDISGLENIIISNPISENCISCYKKISSINSNLGITILPDIELHYNEEGNTHYGNELLNVLDYFHPKQLFGSFSFNDLKLLSKFTELENLEIWIIDSINISPVPQLPALPKLKQLSIALEVLKKTNEDSSANQTIKLNNFLIKNRQITKLTVFYDSSDSLDISFIGPLKKLKVFNFKNTKGGCGDIELLKNIACLRQLKYLEFINIPYGETVMDTIFSDLRNIRWLYISENTPQDELNWIINFHPKIEVLAIDNDSIESYKPLKTLRNLYGLIIMDSVVDMETIQTMKNLKYLSVPKYIENDTIVLAALQNSLPETKIAFNERMGGCLGSGWFLLLIPFVLIFHFLGRLKNIDANY